MGSKERKARKRAGIPFEHKTKEPTGTYISKDDQRKMRKKLDAAIREAADVAREEEKNR